MTGIRARRTSAETSGSSGPSSAGILPPAGLDAPKLKAILNLSKSADIERGRSPNDALLFGAWGEGGLCGKDENERRWSAWGLRLKSCQVRAKILNTSPQGKGEL